MMFAKLENVTLVQPQERNLHGKVFGGHLMRLVSRTEAVIWSTFVDAAPELRDDSQAL